MSKQSVTLHGNKLLLSGNSVRVGDKAPDFTVLDPELQPVKLSDFRGKTVVLLTVPSLDTPVCDMEVRRFNRRATGLASSVEILVVSMDLPFAQKRWCGGAGMERVKVLSDHLEAAVGTSYGVLISALRLLARGVFVINPEGHLTYSQIVSEVAEEPDYDGVFEALQQAL